MDRETFAPRRIIQVRQRVQIIVIFEELDPKTQVATEHEIVMDSVDRPLPVPYDQ